MKIKESLSTKMHCAPKPAWRPFLWRNNRCFGFQSIIYYYHPVVILANFNFFILKLYQRNVYNLHLLLFLTSEGKDVNKCIVVDNDSLSQINASQNFRCHGMTRFFILLIVRLVKKIILANLYSTLATFLKRWLIKYFR
jgi:hypothetical protein